MAALRSLDERRAAALEQLCEAIVPGSGRVRPVVYIDALLTAMSAPEREAALASIDALAEAAAGGAEALRPHAFTPQFLQLRGARRGGVLQRLRGTEGSGPSAYEEIGFNVSPLAARVKKDWSYLGIGG
jgi:hypothetical protein